MSTVPAGDRKPGPGMDRRRLAAAVRADSVSAGSARIPRRARLPSDDVLRLNDHEDRLYELVDGILVEKTVGLEESWLACKTHHLARQLSSSRGTSVWSPARTACTDSPRVWSGFPMWPSSPGIGSRTASFPKNQSPTSFPTSPSRSSAASNTRKEMEEKLKEYFEKGVRLVWFVRPRSRVVDVYTTADEFTRLTASATLDGGDVLPGFSVLVGDLFRKPSARAGENPTGSGARPDARSHFDPDDRRVTAGHARHGAPVSPGDLRRDRRPPGAARDDLRG